MRWLNRMRALPCTVFFIQDLDARHYLLMADLILDGKAEVAEDGNAVSLNYEMMQELQGRLCDACWFFMLYCHITGFDPQPYMTATGQWKMFADEKPVARHRYPRGYTPERMAQVRSLPVEVTNHTEFAPTREERQNAVHPPMTGPAGVREVQEAIARSTIPAEHFEDFSGAPFKGVEYGSNKITTTAAERKKSPVTPLEIHLNKKSPRDTSSSLASFDPVPSEAIKNLEEVNKRAIEQPMSSEEMTEKLKNKVLLPIERSRGTVSIGSEFSTLQHAQQGLIHELGHYKSVKIDKNPLGGAKGIKGAREEARADDYEQEHWRPDPRDVKRGKEKNFPKKSMYWDGKDDQEEFEPWTPHGNLRYGLGLESIPGQNDVSPYEHEQSWVKSGGPKAHLEYLRARTTPLVTDRRNEQAKAARKRNRMQTSQPEFFSGTHLLSSRPPAPSGKGKLQIDDAYDPLLETTEKRHKKAQEKKERLAQNRQARASRNLGRNLGLDKFLKF
jgi:hypothetical protein